MSWVDWRRSLSVMAVAGAVFGLAVAQEGGTRSTEPDNPKEKQAKPVEAPKLDKGLLSRIVVARPAEALGGKDAVALVASDQVADGRRDQTSIFDGQTYSFSNDENKAKFDETPSAYAPVLSGFSVVAYKDGGKLVPGSVEFRTSYDGRQYLFATQAEKEAFEADRKSFEDIDILLQGFSPISLVEEEVLRRGDKAHEVVFEGRRVRLADAKEKEEFLARPYRYFPSLGGIDPVSIADGKPEIGLARFSAVYKNRLYSMASEGNRKRFLENAVPYSDLDVADGGRDPVALVDDRVDEPGHYGISTVYRGQRFLFSNEANREKFVKDSHRYEQERSRVQPSGRS